jgi:hypothetical protein
MDQEFFQPARPVHENIFVCTEQGVDAVISD